MKLNMHQSAAIREMCLCVGVALFFIVMSFCDGCSSHRKHSESGGGLIVQNVEQ